MVTPQAEARVGQDPSLALCPGRDLPTPSWSFAPLRLSRPFGRRAGGLLSCPAAHRAAVWRWTYPTWCSGSRGGTWAARRKAAKGSVCNAALPFRRVQIRP